MTKKFKIIKIKKLPKNLNKGRLRNNSFNQKVFLAIANLIKQTGKGIVKAAGAYYDLIDGFDMVSVVKKFHGTYYADKEENRIREKIRKEWELKKALRNLNSMGYIKIGKDAKRGCLTEKGILEFLRFRIEGKGPKWDGKWRIVVFDIAEEKRNKRDFLRRRLSWLGFRELQKSVWVFPYDVKKELEELFTISKADIQGDIRFLTVEKMEEDRDFREEFGLG